MKCRIHQDREAIGDQEIGGVTIYSKRYAFYPLIGGNKESNGLPLEGRGSCCRQVETVFHDRYDSGLLLFETFHTLDPRERE